MRNTADPTPTATALRVLLVKSVIKERAGKNNVDGAEVLTLSVAVAVQTKIPVKVSAH